MNQELAFNSTQLLRCQECDPTSQRELYEFYKGRVLGICKRYTKNKSEAEDVFQETFIRVFNHVDQVKDIEHLEAWLRKTTINAAINYFHKNKRHQHAQEKNGYEFQDEEYELILSQFTDQVLTHCINELPDGYRMVFNLYAIEGYSHAEIGELMKISENTSRSKLSRARQALKSKLNALGILNYEKYA